LWQGLLFQCIFLVGLTRKEVVRLCMLQAFIDAVRDGKSVIMEGMEYVVLSRNYYEQLREQKLNGMSSDYTVYDELQDINE